jgi:hypothetical protein
LSEKRVFGVLIKHKRLFEKDLKPFRPKTADLGLFSEFESVERKRKEGE